MCFILPNANKFFYTFTDVVLNDDLLCIAKSIMNGMHAKMKCNAVKAV